MIRKVTIHGHPEIVKLLSNNNGAFVDYLRGNDISAKTQLQDECLNEHLDVFKVLLVSGAALLVLMYWTTIRKWQLIIFSCNFMLNSFFLSISEK